MICVNENTTMNELTAFLEASAEGRKMATLQALLEYLLSIPGVSFERIVMALKITAHDAADATSEDEEAWEGEDCHLWLRISEALNRVANIPGIINLRYPR